MEAFGAGIAIVVVLMSLFSFVLSYVYVCEPSEVLIFSGRKFVDETGKISGFRVKGAGWHIQVPILEKVDRIDLRVMPIDIKVENAMTEGGIRLNIHAIANVKISSDHRGIRNAIERFMGTSEGEIQRVCKETLEGILRGIVAKMTPEEINHDRIKFAEHLKTEVDEDLEKLGLVVDTLKIQTVSDNVDYLNSIGRSVISQVIRDAEMAESDSARSAAQAEAEAEARYKVAEQKADMAIKQKLNELNRIKSEFDGAISVEVERTEAAAREARAQAERKLQEVRTVLETLRLQADVVLPAQAEQEARALQAAGEAAYITEKGKATAEVMDTMNRVLGSAGQDGMDVFILQKIDSIMEQITASVQKVKIGSVSLIDSGDGTTLPAYIGSFPMMAGTIMGQLREIIGLDVAGALKNRTGQLLRGPTGDEELYGPDPDLKPGEVLNHFAVEIARERKIGEPEIKILTSLAKALAIEDKERDAVLERVQSQSFEPMPAHQKPLTFQKLYALAYRGAMRDGVLKPKERDVLDKVAQVFGLSTEVLRSIEDFVMKRETAQKPANA